MTRSSKFSSNHLREQVWLVELVSVDVGLVVMVLEVLELVWLEVAVVGASCELALL